MTARSPCYAPRRALPTTKPDFELEERTLQSRSGKRPQDPIENDAMRPAKTGSADPSSRAQPRYLVTFDGLMEVPDMDDMIESSEREVEVIRHPALC